MRHPVAPRLRTKVKQLSFAVADVGGSPGALIGAPAFPPFAIPRIAPLIAIAIGLRLLVLAVIAQRHGGFIEAICQADCVWYERIAQGGYGVNTQWGSRGSLPNWVFFPVYPGLLSLVSLALPMRIGGILLSSALFGLFLAAGARYLRQTRQTVSPISWVALVVLFPVGIFFTVTYTESLFALLGTASLAAMASRRPWLAAAAAALGSAARPTGILLAPLIALDRLRALRAALPVSPRRAAILLAPAALAPLGLILFSFAQWAIVGDPLTFSHQQIHWHRVWVGPWNSIPAGLAAWDFGNMFGVPSHSFEAFYALAGLSIAAIQAVRGRLAEAWLLAGCILLPASTGLDSIPRFVSCNPAFLFALHDFFAGRRTSTVLFCVASAGCFVGLADIWLQGTGSIF